MIIYLAFISLGLPDSLLGSAWPSMYGEMDVPVSFAGVLSMLITAGTILSSLMSDRLTRKFGAGKVTLVSVAMTVAALFGFSVSGSFWMLCLWTVPYGLGAGSVDAALNNYVAVYYASRHITAILLFSLPLWKGRSDASAADQAESAPKKPLSLRQILRIPGAKEVMLAFFSYCALEQTTMLWASSYLVLHNHITPETAAGYASLFFIGITVGRAVNGFLTFKFTDVQMIRTGQCLIAVGAAAMLLPLDSTVTPAGLVVIGLGCAPVYPCIIHSTPAHFGADRSQALIGIQMASAYVGTCLMPPLFGLLANHISVSLLPVYLLAVLALMVVMHERLLRKTRRAPVNT